MAAEQVVEATILAVEPEGNGWVKIRTDQGELTTKWPEPIAEAQAHMGQRVPIAYETGEARQGRNGQWYPAPRYFKRVVPGYQQPQGVAPQPQPLGQTMVQPQPPQPSLPQPIAQQQVNTTPRPDESVREMRIMRQTAGKLAVHTMALVPSDQRTFANQVAIAEAWVRYFMSGPPEVRVAQQEQAMAAVGMHPDGDDIPF